MTTEGFLASLSVEEADALRAAGVQRSYGDWVGPSREAVSKAFQLLRTLHIVETGRRRVTVLDLGALRRHARVTT